MVLLKVILGVEIRTERADLTARAQAGAELAYPAPLITRK
jgi:hypothetical protein